MSYQDLFEQFVREKTYLLGVTKKTISWYNQCWTKFVKCVGVPEKIDRAILNQYVIQMREDGLQAVSCNVYICGINSFLSWLHENHYLDEKFKIKELKEEKKVMDTFTEAHVKAFVSWKPKGFYQWRMYALICTLLDTGCRIEELLTLTVENCDLDALSIRVIGKGNKERVVPISNELRKILFRWRGKHKSRYMFPTRDGERMRYRNTLRDFKMIAARLGITGVRISFHNFRHGFAMNYVRQGGSLFHLQKALGHSSLQTTRRYCELTDEDLRVMHLKTSQLERMKH
jgi:Site-specific recombinase XerD